MAEPDPKELAYQMARKDEYSCSGLAAFTIAGIVIISVAITLRMVSRRLARAKYTADDWTLVIAWVLTVCAQAMYLCNNFKGRTCYHSLTVDKTAGDYQGRHWYAWGLFYTTGYPIARISLCLLYARVFVKRWFRLVCWVLIGCFAGYSISTVFVDIFATLPIEAAFDSDVKATRVINFRALYLANASFNVATDAVLLALPLSVIWRLKMNWPQKVGLSAVFCIGGLTVVASIMRLQSYLAWKGNDPNFILQATPQWWTIAELNLGILCPCLVAFGPLVRTTYFHFASRTSSPMQTRLQKLTGIPTPDPLSSDPDHPMSHYEKAASMSAHSLRSRPSNLEGGFHTQSAVGIAEPMPAMLANGRRNTLERDGDGMALDQEAALASLDPRTLDGVDGGAPLYGTSSSAGFESTGRIDMPGHKIGISRDYKLERE